MGDVGIVIGGHARCIVGELLGDSDKETSVCDVGCCGEDGRKSSWVVMEVGEDGRS